jgi:hypothetical protein
LGRAKEQWMEMQEELSNRRLASTLGISYEELDSLEWEIHEDRSNDGLLYNYRIEFYDDSDEEVLRRVKGLEDGCRVYLAPWEFEDEIDDPELEWEIESSDQLKIFNAHLESVETLLGISLDQQTEFNLLVMLHAHIIASIEQYISSVFIHKVTNSDALTRKLIETDPEFGNRKFTLNKIYLQHEELKITVASYLKSLIFHDMKKIMPMYKDVLGFEFDDISWLFKDILVRHDCAHRAGYDKEGNKITVSLQGIRELMGKSRNLVNEIESHVNP